MTESLPSLLMALAIILIAAKVGGILAEWIKIPAVVGELVAGIALGNLQFAGLQSPIIHLFSELGVIILLFMVGLESNLNEFKRTGKPALIVAMMGVFIPFLLVLGGWQLLPFDHSNFNQQLFLAATVTATSVGITARVLSDMGRVASAEGRIIIGAAVIDDVLGLLILAVVTALIQDGHISMWGTVWIAGKAVGFLAVAFALGHYVLPHVIRVSSRFDSAGLMGTMAFSTCFLFAFAANAVGLAPIVGAFAAGLVLDDVSFKHHQDARNYSLQSLVKPVGNLLVPIFFVVMGMQVQLSTFADTTIIGGAVLLTVLAILGKVGAGIFLPRGVADKLAVGLGMIPRGEVGLIFAAIGMQLNVVNSAEYAMIVFMVVVTTLITPSLLQWRLQKLS